MPQSALLGALHLTPSWYPGHPKLIVISIFRKFSVDFGGPLSTIKGLSMENMENTYTIVPVGIIHSENDSSSVEIFDEYKDALLGLKDFSHIIILAWFHKNDTKEKRATLRVHPRGNRNNPLTGVFATRSPVRPNPVSHFTSRITSIKENIINIERINAFEGSPVIDIKPFVPKEDTHADVRLPDWV
jgi:tRNA-Thr(GGU) m(6)t(6)A37 methyltransferase TsaA